MGSVSHSFSTLPSGVKVQPTPFHISVSDSDLSQLRSLIQQAVIPPEQFYNKHANAATGKFGITRDWLVTARDHWLNKYDWRAQESFINSFPQFQQTVVGPSSGQTFSLHFAALFSRRPDAIPVILMHGWPGSFLEFIPMLDLLRERYTPETLPYHVIVPSIPDYGFSTRLPSDCALAELTTDFAAEAMNELMLSLGFDESSTGGYVAQGGDVGYALARAMANNHAACRASHLNMFMFTPDQWAACQTTEPLSEREERLMSGTRAWMKQGSAYAYEHGTRPSTIALTLGTNPVAMLAWMGEKFVEWSDNVYSATPLTLDQILDGVSLYWFSGCFGRTMWSYRALVPEIGATAVVQEKEGPAGSVQKPFGYSAFPVEIGMLPRTWGKKLFGDRLVWYREHEVGGHFAALQQPREFLEDLESYLAFIAPMVGIAGHGNAKKGN
ncbi:Alpha/Beta hydrolase protein [Pseudoneurospora amorphoporcata]|uniref:Alpha/Beta hydrolase protein n=1 Tax=Pseudoneurospora amorphoporcata TaxID=241081 RepID=A0AAN6SDG8_9PEZI|nr:Alpha/Beta hydrolase protein [Pseudoneurospora amorphoporcata]